MSDSSDVRMLIEPYLTRLGGPISALRRLVAEFGCVEPEHLTAVADAFNLSIAEVRGIASFYADLRETRAGARHIRICQAEACQAQGGRALTSQIEEALGLRLGETLSDGSVTVDPIFCLGLCASGPAAMVNDEVIACASVERLLK